VSYLIGIDGGGTRTTVALADARGAERVRRVGPPGIVDPRDPLATVEVLIALVRDVEEKSGYEPPAAALCAGLAGVGHAAEREAVHAALARAGVAERVTVVSDGQIALEGAFAGEAGVLVVAGTGSIAYGRGRDGRIERCGGWGMVVGDEGGAYAVGRAALVEALRGVDGRGEATSLLPAVLERLGLTAPDEIPPWAGRAEKADVAALASVVIAVAAAGDRVATRIMEQAARDLASHVRALVERLAPWGAAPEVVFFGGMFRAPGFADLVEAKVERAVPGGCCVRQAREDAVGGALAIARRLADGGR
jgi:glucosamine kinase